MFHAITKDVLCGWFGTVLPTKTVGRLSQTCSRLRLLFLAWMIRQKRERGLFEKACKANAPHVIHHLAALCWGSQTVLEEGICCAILYKSWDALVYLVTRAKTIHETLYLKAILHAIETHTYRALSQLLHCGKPVSKRIFVNALTRCCEMGQADTIQLLLSASREVWIPLSRSSTYLFHAANSGSVKAFKTLLQYPLITQSITLQDYINVFRKSTKNYSMTRALLQHDNAHLRHEAFVMSAFFTCFKRIRSCEKYSHDWCRHYEAFNEAFSEAQNTGKNVNQEMCDKRWCHQYLENAYRRLQKKQPTLWKLFRELYTLRFGQYYQPGVSGSASHYEDWQYAARLIDQLKSQAELKRTLCVLDTLPRDWTSTPILNGLLRRTKSRLVINGLNTHTPVR